MGEVDIAERGSSASPDPIPKPPIAIINELAVSDLVDVDDAIALVRQAMLDLSAGRVDAPQRWAMPVGSGILALMPGAMPDRDRFGIKVLSLFGKPGGDVRAGGHQGLMLLFDAQSGRPLTIIDADSLTGLRTAAASAVATDALARPESSSVAMIGCGEQARWHVRALCRVRPIDAIRLWSRTPDRARDFAIYVERQNIRAIICQTAQEAVRGADIICTLTRSTDPVIQGKWLSPGQHLNLVGSSTSLSREVDEETVARGRFIVDSHTHAMSQGGELLAAIAAGVVSAEHIHAEIGDVLAGRASGREDQRMITVYKSLGHVAQDLAVAIALQERAARSRHTLWAAW